MAAPRRSPATGTALAAFALGLLACGRLGYAPDARSASSDAAGLDVSLPDARGLDALLPDALLPDALLPDAPLPDAPLPDAPGADAALPDVGLGPLDAPLALLDAPSEDAARFDARTIDIGPMVCGFVDGEDGEGVCPAACTGGCGGGRCTISCEGIDRCLGMTLRCPSGWPCEVRCDGIDSCAGSAVDATAARSLSLECDGIDGCDSIAVMCPTGGDCEMSCDDDACTSASIACGGGRCRVDCDMRTDDVVSMSGCPSALCCARIGCR